MELFEARPIWHAVHLSLCALLNLLEVSRQGSLQQATLPRDVLLTVCSSLGGGRWQHMLADLSTVEFEIIT